MRRPPRGRIAYRCFGRAAAAAAALWLAAPAAHALQIELVPAWEGNYRPGTATEVLVRVTSPVGGSVTIRATEPRLTTVAQAALEPNVTAQVAFAIRPGASDTTIDARLGYGDPVTQSLQLVPLERPMIAVVVDHGVDVGDWLGAAGRYVPVPVGPQALPRTAAGYAALAAIVLGADTLGALDAPQTAALLAHVGTCGRVFLPRDATLAARELAAHSACGARFVTQLGAAAEAAAYIGVRAAALPTDAQLLALDPHTPGVWGLAAAFHGGYVVLLAALAALLLAAPGKVRWPALLAAPPLAALLMIAAWAQNPPERRALLWVEQEHDARVARYRLLYDLHGRGGGEIDVAVATALGTPDNLAAIPATLTRAQDEARLTLGSRVLSRHTFGFSGHYAAAPAFGFGRDDAGLNLTYHGAGTSPPAVLALNDRYFAVPALAAGATWRPAADDEALPRAAVPAPLLRRGDALLVPLAAGALPIGVPPHDAAVAWLLVHAPGAQAL